MSWADDNLRGCGLAACPWNWKREDGARVCCMRTRPRDCRAERAAGEKLLVVFGWEWFGWGRLEVKDG